MTTESAPPSSHRTRWLLGACADMAAGDRANLWRATWVLAAWGAAYTAAALLIKRSVVPPGPGAYLLALVPSVLAVLTGLAYARFLAHADELQRKIQLEAMALGFGGGFVAAFGLDLLAAAGLPRAGTSDVFTVMMLCYLFGLWRSGRRYA